MSFRKKVATTIFSLGISCLAVFTAQAQTTGVVPACSVEQQQISVRSGWETQGIKVAVSSGEEGAAMWRAIVKLVEENMGTKPDYEADTIMIGSHPNGAIGMAFFKDGCLTNFAILNESTLIQILNASALELKKAENKE